VVISNCVPTVKTLGAVKNEYEVSYDYFLLWKLKVHHRHHKNLILDSSELIQHLACNMFVGDSFHSQMTHGKRSSDTTFDGL
jgi:hypothetical protein